MSTLTNPRTRDTITDIRDTVAGYRGTWNKPDGTSETVEGTWALGPVLSWTAYTHTTDTGFRAGRYIVVCGHWQI